MQAPVIIARLITSLRCSGNEPTLLPASLLGQAGPERAEPGNGAYNDKCPIQPLMILTEELLEFNLRDLLDMRPLYIVHF